ncbi:WD40-repeat-containing domain protein [Mycotypha africana]|uniref:WD40-repeat-containing domain protein n=1 Tax=Mycotypha africana TaxID=64632 RepID=UPI00230102A8|nr:WD40-repeat-containing domain protein [Mycotypha africana]KAI8991790.1 WD40-repeat-containing domain protein [Mycotypha africana]
MSSYTTASEQAQVQVRFTTQQIKYAIQDKPMLLPSDMKKEGLSEIVNSLLDLETPVPFDFLIDGNLLRTSIIQYLNTHQLSTENIITIEYVESMLPPTPLSAFQHDDWISSVCGNGQGLFLTGSYDSMVRLWNTSGECVATLMGHKEAVKNVCFGKSSSSSATATTLFSGSLDHSVLGWAFDETSGASRLMFECKGHKGPVESLSIDASGQQLASASADGFVKVWSTEEPSEDEPDTLLENDQKRKKKRVEKIDDRKYKTRCVNLEGHVGGVNAVVFDPSDSNTVYTGGWDHSIRTWDIENQVNLATKVCALSICSPYYSGLSKLIATGHTDNMVRLWDPRSEDGTNVKMSFRGHSAWVSSVSWSKTSQYNLCSASYDSTLRIWDVRSSKEPLFTVNTSSEDNKEKIFSIYWDNDRLLSGGEDKKLSIHKAKV